SMDVTRGGARHGLDRPRHDRLADDLRRPVALVGDTDELIAESDRTHDLRGGRQERDDAHRASDQTIRPTPGEPGSSSVAASRPISGAWPRRWPRGRLPCP